MTSIPYTFTFASITYNAVLSYVVGAGAHMWHLEIANRHYGRIWLTDAGEWRFSSNTHQPFEALLDDFVRVIVASGG